MTKNQINSISQVQTWVFDIKNQAFIAECQRQSRLVAQSEDAAVITLLDEAINEIEKWE